MEAALRCSPFVRRALRREHLVTERMRIAAHRRECSKNDSSASFSELVAKMHALAF
jgi:hypothetical protein